MAIITTNKNKTPLGIYIHIPFCKSKCEYCDFYSLGGNHEELYADYTDAVCRHIRETGLLAPKHRVDTIYFGGGTPSYFGEEGLATILTAVRKNFDVAPDAEITFECNPDSVTEKLLRRLKAEGFNRASLGIQCDDDGILAALGRPHSYRQAVQAFQKLRKEGFDNISVDLMYGLPQQSPFTWRDTLQNVLSLRPDHISCYGLKVEPGTPLYEYQDRVFLPSDDTQVDMYLAACEILKENKYEQYEISNFARRGKFSRHNMKYWTGGEYIGFGPNAASDFAGKYYTIVGDLKAYIEGIRTGGQVIADVLEIPVRERAGDYLMLRLRTNRGISAQEYERQYLLPFGPLEDELKKCAERGHAVFEKDRWHLTPRGMMISNSIISELQLIQDRCEPLTRRRM
ncbi:MAG: radical SAM family heme chaperone HemW [Oscillospiraceae bacterium]|nr:radical SAM family heme chaperone HemW [Oscillospiraceae bacterium]